ncbi:MAG: radical SAM protein [Oscillospiraceae bacterium]|jgi:radical SAM protein with 4Fe4S-binding SPASM domain|nr:radical SAM protein [Oscillospiraceae bacterium]
MFFSLTHDSFVRIYDDIAYVTNQLLKSDKVYDQSGKLFVEQIKRHPQNIENSVCKLFSQFTDTDYDEVFRDYLEFILDLEKEGYVVTGESIGELSNKMPHFNYSDPFSKTLPQLQYETNSSFTDTADYLYGYFKKNPKIFSFHMELTKRCNERCRHCYLPNTRDMRDMETPLALGLMDQLAEEGTLGLTLSGGECLLHPDFIQILDYARKSDFSISILSNVALMTNDVLEAVKEANINLLQVSVYSMVPEEHDWVTRVKGSHAATMSSLEKLIAANIPVQISCPTMKKTYRSYQGVLKWAYKHRVKGYTDFIMMGRTDKSTDNLENRLSYEETKELLQQMLQIDIEYKALLNSGEDFPVDETLREKAVCGAGTDSMCITANGDFYPCAGFQGYPLGNAYKQSIRDVWNNSPAIKQLRGITWEDFPKCLKCAAKPFCSMCMVRNFNESGDMFKVNQHFCDVAFLNKQLAEEYIHNREIRK